VPQGQFGKGETRKMPSQRLQGLAELRLIGHPFKANVPAGKGETPLLRTTCEEEF
jgi:hypothetical protein